MARSRVEALDERVTTLQERVDRLCEEHTEVRERLRAVERAGDGSRGSASRRTLPETGSAWTEAGFHPRSGGPGYRDADVSDEASPAEVEAAVRAVEGEIGEVAKGSSEAADEADEATDEADEAADETSEETRDDILVA